MKRSKLPSGGKRGVFVASFAVDGGAGFSPLFWTLAGLLVPATSVSEGLAIASSLEFDDKLPKPFSPKPTLNARAISANINSRASVGDESGPSTSVVGKILSLAVAAGSVGGAEGRKPRRSRIVPHACLIRSVRPAPGASGTGRGRGSPPNGGDGRGKKGVDGGGASPDDRIGSEEPVSKEAAVAAAATLDKTKKK